MSDSSIDSRGQQLLRLWQGDLLGKDAAVALELDEPTFSRIRNGIRLPTGAQAYRIEQLTDGAVSCRSWYEPPVANRKPSRLIRRAAAR